MIKHVLEPWHSLLQHFEGYSSIFRDIDVYSATLTGVQLGRRGEAFPVLFQNREKSPDFGKKSPYCSHFWVKFYIQNVVLKSI